jgi:hypothetical protein
MRALSIYTTCILAVVLVTLTFCSTGATAPRTASVIVVNDTNNPVPITSADSNEYFTAYSECDNCDIMVVPAGKRAIITDIFYANNPGDLFYILNNGQRILMIGVPGDGFHTRSLHLNSGLVSQSGSGVISIEGGTQGITLTGYFIPAE